MNSGRRTIDPALAKLLGELAKTEGSLRAAATRAKISPDVLNRVYRGDGSFGEVTAQKLARTYGARWRVGVEKIREWAGIPPPNDDLFSSASSDTFPPLPATARILENERDYLGPDDLAEIDEVVAGLAMARANRNRRRPQRPDD